MKQNPSNIVRDEGTSYWCIEGERYPIVDAAYGSRILIHVTAADIACAIPLDENKCALAQAWMRQTDTPVAMIGVDKAYLLTRVKGRMVALRCQVPAETTAAIQHFDETGEMPDDGFWLEGIRPSETINSQRMQQKRHRQRWEEKGKPAARRVKRLHLRNASRRAQVVHLP